MSYYEQLMNNIRRKRAEETGSIHGDYDYGADSQGPNELGHYTDKGKLPYHPTFSEQSIYANEDTPGGKWAKDKDEFTPSHRQVQQPGYTKGLADYFRQEYGRGITSVKYPVPYATPKEFTTIP